MTIPARTNRLHILPYWKGDSYYAIRVASSRKARRRGGGHYIDLNFQRTSNGAVCLHWGTARQNGYHYIVVKGIRRAMSDEQLDRPLYKWTTEEVKKWRRTKRWGPTLAARIRPISFYEAVKYAKKRGVTVCAEVKSKTFATHPEIVRHLRAQAVQLHATVYIMTLVTMDDWGPKLKVFKEAGFQTALLAHGAHKPKNFAQYDKYIDVVWGAWHK